jgi:hypothetical protein
MLGHPEAVVAERIAKPRERYRVADRLAVWTIDDGDRLIEDGQAQRSISPVLVSDPEGLTPVGAA